MARFKFTMKFSLSSYSWQEHLYTPDTTLADAQARGDAIAGHRAALLASGATMEAAVLSDVAIIGDSVPSFETQSLGTSSTASDQPWQALLIRLRNGLNYTRNYFLRGIPDPWIDRNALTGADVYATQLTSGLDAYFDAVVGNGYCLRAQRKVGLGAFSGVITGVAVGADISRTKITTAVAVAGLAQQKGVILQGFGKSAKVLNKKWPVMDFNGGLRTFEIPFNSSSIRPVPVGDMKNAIAICEEIIYPTIDGWTIERPTSRNPGRPLYTQPGKRKRKTT